MNNYRDIIVPRTNFKYSVNLQHDLFEAERLSQYIPLEHSISVLSDLFYSVIGDKPVNSRILYGSYGTGKSHLITVLASILGKGLPEADYYVFCKAVEAVDNQLAKKIRDFIINSSPYLIVPVLSYGLGPGIEFEQIIYRSLIRALHREHLKFTFQDAFHEAKAIIAHWMTPENEDARKRFQGILDKQGLFAEQLMIELSNYDVLAMSRFESLFSEMTFGMSFQPPMRDLSQNLDETNLFIIENGYRGIVFIFDEFGRYLEDYMESFKIKSLQDLAEYCDHRHFDNHLLLISHQDISLYIRPSDLHKIDEWKKVEGRFEPASMVPDKEQLLKIIQYVIPKQEPQWSSFQKKHQLDFKRLAQETATLDVFSPLISEEEFYSGIVLGAFPLNPMVAFILERLSKTIAQNERSIFTFLASNDPYSLGNFLDSHSLKKFTELTADWIYNYFAPILENQQRGFIYAEYLQYRSALNKLNRDETNLELKRSILKAMVLINIVNDYENIKPTPEIFKIILSEGHENIERALADLEQAKIIIYMRHYGYYRFFDASSIDVDALIENTVKQQNGSNFFIDILNEEFIPIPGLPEEYNDKYKMTRYYLPKFAVLDQMEGLKKQKAVRHWDGLMVFLLADKELNSILNLLCGENILFVWRQDSWELVKEVKRYAAIEYLLNKQSEVREQDPLAVEELRARQQEKREYIRHYIDEWARPSSEKNHWVYNGTILYNEIFSQSSLSSFLSAKLGNSFDRTIIINNEMVNKNRLSGVMRGFRKEIVDKILWSESLDDSLGFRKLSGQHAFWRSVAVKNAIVPECNDEPPAQLNEANISRNQIAEQLMQELQSFLDRANHESLEFKMIYDTLKKPPYGLRDGYIPLLLAIAMRPYRHNIFIDLQGNDQQLNADLLERMLEYPGEFTISIDHWPEEKEKYIAALENQFYQYIDANLRKGHRLMALHKAMLDYYRTVSRLGRSSHDLVNEPTRQFRQLLENNVSDYRKFFFQDMLMSLSQDYNGLAEQVVLAVAELDSVIDKMNFRIEKSICQVFTLDGNQAILPQLLRLYRKDWQQKAGYAFHFLTNRFLDMLAELEPTLTDSEFIAHLAVLLTGFEIPYWGDRQLEEFYQVLLTIQEQLRLFIPVQDGALVIDSNGQKKALQLSDQPLTQNQEVLKRMLQKSLDDFAQSLSYEQKQQVIVEVLRKYI